LSEELNLLVPGLKELIRKTDALRPMLNHIDRSMPELSRARQNFGKTQSQFMDNMLTVSCPTPLRNLHQILAEIEQIRNALRATYFRQKKIGIELKIKRKSASDLRKNDPIGQALTIEHIEAEVEEIESDIEAGQIYPPELSEGS
jgi:hypothetical protein